jgi:hypothetical protein
MCPDWWKCNCPHNTSKASDVKLGLGLVFVRFLGLGLEVKGLGLEVGLF